MTKTTVGILIFDDVEELDFVGPWEVFGYLRKLTGAVDVLTLAERAEPVRAAKGLRVLADCTLDASPPLDVVLVPGGQGTRRELGNPRILEFLRDAAPRCRWVTSVCTGALVLHAAGLLEGKRATTHWASTDLLEGRGGVTVVRGAQRAARDRVRPGAALRGGGVAGSLTACARTIRAA